MNENRIDKKYFGWIWLLIFVASLIRYSYQLYVGYLTGVATAREIIFSTFFNLVLYGLIPAWLCYCSASIFWTMSARRGYRSVPRNDFIYTTMLFTSAARVLMGVIELFAVLDSRLYTYTSVLLDVTVLSAALYVMYFTVLAKRMNPKEKNDVFNLYSSTYLLFQGLHTGVPCVVYFLMSGGTVMSDEIAEIINLYDVDMTVDSSTITACIIALCVLAAYVIATVILSAVLTKKAKEYNPPKDDKPDDNGDPFGGNPFADDGKGEDDKVFEEFDI